MTMFPIWKTAFVMSFLAMTLAGVESFKSKHPCLKSNQNILLRRLNLTSRSVHNNGRPTEREWVDLPRHSRNMETKVPEPKHRFARTIELCDDFWEMSELKNQTGDTDSSKLLDRMVLLRRYGEYSILCGGVWITDMWILASAHCLTKYGPIIWVSSYGYSNWDHSKDSYKLFIHSKFQSKVDRYDIGLVKVTLPNDRITSPCAPDLRDDTPDGDDACIGFRWARAEKTIDNEKVTVYELHNANATTYQQDDQFMYLKNKKYGQDFATWECPVLCRVKSGEHKLLGVMSHVHCKERKGLPFKKGTKEELTGHYPAATRISQYLPWISTIIENN